MYTECRSEQLTFQGFEGAPVVVDFNGGEITSDAGAVLLSEVERISAIVGRLAGCCMDLRDQRRIDHPLETMLMQRVVGMCLGYEDINDHEQLRHVPLFGMICRKAAVPRETEEVRALAGKSTLQRAETPGSARYHRIQINEQRVAETFVEV